MHPRQPVEGVVGVTRRTRDTIVQRWRRGLNGTTPSHARRSWPREVLRSSTTLENVDPRPRLIREVKPTLFCSDD